MPATKETIKICEELGSATFQRQHHIDRANAYHARVTELVKKLGQLESEARDNQNKDTNQDKSV